MNEVEQAEERCRILADGLAASAPAALRAIDGARQRLKRKMEPWYKKLWRRLAQGKQVGETDE